MIALITTALSIVAVFLELWIQNSPQRKKEEANEALQNSRQALIDGDIPSIELRIDGLLQEGNGNSPARLESAEDVERRISQL